MKILAILLLLYVASPCLAVPFCGGELEIKDRWDWGMDGHGGAAVKARERGAPCVMSEFMANTLSDDLIAVLYCDEPVRVPPGTSVTLAYGDSIRIPARGILYPWDILETGFSSAFYGFTTTHERTATKTHGWVLILRFPLGSLPREWEPDSIAVHEGGDDQ